MKSIFKNTTQFTILYFTVLFIDIFLKEIEGFFYLRMFTKASVLLLLMVYFYYSRQGVFRFRDKLFLSGLVVFMIGDFFLTLYQTMEFYILGMILFIIGKLIYTARFSNQNDFSTKKLIPFFVIIFFYIVFITIMVYDNLGDFFIPVLIYLFASMILALFTYLRKDVVNKISFLIVLLGVISSVFSDSITVLQSFYDQDFGYHQYTIMFFYGLFQYLVVIGITKEELISNEIKPHL